MSYIEKIQLFEDKRVRTTWDEKKQEWFFSIVDVCGILTDQPTHKRARNYWKVLKSRLKKEGAEVAKATRKEVEKRVGHSDIKSPEEIPFPEEQKVTLLWPFLM